VKREGEKLGIKSFENVAILKWFEKINKSKLSI
jgi:hypothetical protein